MCPPNGLFIIDDRGILRQITMNDLPVGRSVDETLRLVQAFQYTDKHGEVCPAGWKPGQDTVSIHLSKNTWLCRVTDRAKVSDLLFQTQKQRRDFLKNKKN
uniref:thioredoxin-dependent peroxiredoxin n=1 Tax=Timema californicum TaxID=61474 RepID=A0A7R9JHI6_TIMCA|nr:unnamed protein product [Timema californicum]